MPVSTSSNSGLGPVAGAVGAHQVAVREAALRVVVAPAHPRVGRRGVEVPPVLLGVLAVVALRAGQAEDPLLEDRVLAVPQRQREAERLPVVADAGQAVLVPPVRPGPGVVVREVVPGGAVVAVVLADRAPGPLGQVGPPGPPGAVPRVGLGQPCLLRPTIIHGPYSSRTASAPPPPSRAVTPTHPFCPRRPLPTNETSRSISDPNGLSCTR